ncbi:MAG: hypothetical protein EXX96DRAFT_569962 [Benjaminiella poitrasii]|nr:MAG: hypothetical protein EXX96DRAFT_569962 [Benjaminiella poitrasii]
MILNHRIQLLPFFVVHQLHPVIDNGIPDMTPILYRLQHDGTSILCLRPCAIKAMLIHNMLLAQDRPHPMLDIPFSRWRPFLAARMLTTTRNLWYHLIVAKLLDRATLSRIIPATVPSPLCHYCNQTKTVAHLLFECPRKAGVWNVVDSTYLVTSTGTSSQRLFTDISFLQFSHCDPAPTLSPLATFDVVGVVLTAIWSSYWNGHFNCVPFSSTNILQIIRNKLHHLHSIAFHH